MGKKVQKSTSTEVSTEVLSFEDDADLGFETADRDAYAIPFLQVLQKMSPQCDEDNAAYLKGSKPGMFFNSVTEKLYDGEKGVLIVPCAYKRSINEWADRDSGGGFIAEHVPGTVTPIGRNEKGQDIAEGGHLLIDTRSHFVLVLDEDNVPMPIIMALTSTQLKKSRRWMSQMQNLKLEGRNGFYTPPMFSHVYRVTTVPEQNDKGTWRGVKIEMVRQLDGKNPKDVAIYHSAKNFREMVNQGTVQAAQPQATQDDVDY